MRLPRRNFCHSLLLAAALPFVTVAPIFAQAPDKPTVTGVAAKLQPFLDNQTLAGAVTLLATKDRVLNLEAIGYADLATKKPMQTDDLFWIASMTKPMTAVCVAILEEAGKLSYDDAVEKHLPEFANQWLVSEQTPERRVLVKPARPITIRDLLTHTSGVLDAKQPRPRATLAEICAAYGHEPLAFPPGSKWQYSTAGINVLGRIVEVVSGQSFESFLQERVLDPLGMKDTSFWPNAEQASRLAKSYNIDKTTKALIEVPVSFLDGADVTDRKRMPKPGGGLFSTAIDVTRFYQMMLHDGSLNGKVLLKPESAKRLVTTQSGDIKTGFTEGMSWGFGFQVVREPQDVTAMLNPGTFGHSGAYGTASWADPKRDLIYIMLIQRAGLGNGDQSEIRKAFQEAASAAVK